MEYLAKITHEQKLENSHLWKYTFLDTQTNKQDYFYHHQPISYDLDTIGKLSISSNKFLQSFKKEIGEVIERTKQREILTELEGEARNNVDKLFGKLSKKQINLSPQKLHELHTQGFTWKEIGVIYGKSEPTIYRWIKPNDKSLQKRGVKSKIIGNTLELLCSYVFTNNTKTLKEMADYLFQETSHSFSVPTIFRTLKKYNISWKKATKQYFELDKEKFKQFVKDNYWLLDLNSTYALDECGFNFGGVPRYAYAPTNSRAIVKQLGQKGVNQTLLLCVQNVNKNVTISYKLIKGGAKSHDFHNFFSSIDFPTKERRVLLDNARIHHATKSCQKVGLSAIKELAKEKNAELVYLVPYSPQLNPAELCINFIRQYVKKYKARTDEKLAVAIEEAIKLLREKDLTKFFKKCFDFKID